MTLGSAALKAWGPGVGFLLFLVATGFLASDFLLSLLTLALLFAYLGSGWNIMLGIAGQLSLGHALFLGIGAYSTAVMSVKFGITPWIGLMAGIGLAMIAGAFIGLLSFRFGVKGIYFALLTIAFAEFGRIVASSWGFIGGMAGIFYPALSTENFALASLRGNTQFNYFLCLFLALLGVLITWVIRMTWVGFLWRAIRDDEEAARALGVRALRHKILATMLSAGMTALGGGVFGLIQGVVFPDSIMGMQVSVEILMGPIVGGLGTAFGPLLGSFIVIPLSHFLSSLGDVVGIPGLNNVSYGLILIMVMWRYPDGLIPAGTKWLRKQRSATDGMTRGPL